MATKWQYVTESPKVSLALKLRGEAVLETMVACVVMGLILEVTGVLILIATAKNSYFGAVLMFMGVLLVLVAVGMTVVLITGIRESIA